MFIKILVEVESGFVFVFQFLYPCYSHYFTSASIRVGATCVETGILTECWEGKWERSESGENRPHKESEIASAMLFMILQHHVVCKTNRK